VLGAEEVEVRLADDLIRGHPEAGRLPLAHPQEAGVQVLAVDLLGTLDSKLFSQSRSICARV
jgi:hypothetical protein